MSTMTCPELECSAASDTGPVREENQDSIRLPEGFPLLERGPLYGLADGMGGYTHGKFASDLALDKLFQIFYEDGTPPNKALRRGVEAANLSIMQATQRLNAGRMGTTLLAMHIEGNRLSLAHVGDSRLYLVRENSARCLTGDHSLAGDLVRAKVISPHKVRAHAQRSILTKCVGLDLFIQPDISRLTLQNDDTLILCSDGLWGVIEDDEFAQAVRDEPIADALSQRLINMALERDTDDNASVIVVAIKHILSPTPEQRRRFQGLPAIFRGLTGAE
jgi:PPM family protein phosphatase